MTKQNSEPSANKAKQINGRRRSVAIFLQKLVYYLSKTWFGFAMLVSFLFLLLGLLAPALMAENNVDTAQSIYRFLAINNHQLPERSYFLFGEDGSIQTYSIAELVAQGMNVQTRESFIGNETIGYKTGLNHRMMSIFIGMFIGGLAWGLSRGKLRIGLFIFLLLLLPILLDGFSHMISDTSNGFRDINNWARFLTGNAFSDTFYNETTAGSLNWWFRVITGTLFGLGITWYLFTRFDDYFKKVRQRLEPRLRELGAIR